MTFINYLGIKISGIISTIGVIVGTIIPGSLIIFLGLMWFFSGKATNIKFSINSLVPDISHIGNIVFLVGLFLAFSGLEVTSGYAGEVKNPKKNYPKAIIIAAIITFFLFFTRDSFLLYFLT